MPEWTPLTEMDLSPLAAIGCPRITVIKRKHPIAQPPLSLFLQELTETPSDQSLRASTPHMCT